MTYPADLLSLIDERVAKGIQAAAESGGAITGAAAGTVVYRTGATTCEVNFDGSMLAAPVKVLGDVEALEGDRVAMLRVGKDWTIMGTFSRRRTITMPDGATTGTQRMVWGANTPPELQAYGLTVAMQGYVTDSVTGKEVGYFFQAISNVMDAGPGSRAMVFGNVSYATPGNPTTASVGAVKTNFQMDMFGQSPYTIFKDQIVDYWYPAGIAHDGVAAGRGIVNHLGTSVPTSSIGAETVALTLPSQTYRNGRAYQLHVQCESYAPTAQPAFAWYRVRQTNISGTVWRLWSFPIHSVGGSTQTEATSKVRRVAGSDLSTVVVLTLQGVTNNVISQAVASPLQTREFEIHDCGSSSDYPEAFAI
jgi:hypothetical protein